MKIDKEKEKQPSFSNALFRRLSVLNLSNIWMISRLEQKIGSLVKRKSFKRSRYFSLDIHKRFIEIEYEI